MHPAEFWELTIGDFYDCIDGYTERVDVELQLRDKLNHILGIYVATGVNDPKKYPEKPILDTESSSSKFSFTSDESLDAYICSLANNVKG